MIPDANDDACMQILGTYKLVGRVGTGGYGTVLRVVHNVDHTVPLFIKVMQPDPKRPDTTDRAARSEIGRACQVDARIARSNHLFSRTYGWTCCKELPKEWRPHVKDTGLRPFFILVGEYGQGVDLSKFKFTTLGALQKFMFEVINALYVTFENFKFRHGDLTMNNVIVKTGVTSTRRYSIDDEDYIISSPTEPFFIDFGASTFNNDNKYPLSDVNYLLDDMLIVDEQDVRVHQFPKDQDDWLIQFQKNIKNKDTNYTTLKDVLVKEFNFTESDFFKNLEKGSQEPEAKRQATNCHICRGIATREYQHAPSYKFCDSDKCVRSMGPIGHLLN